MIYPRLFFGASPQPTINNSVNNNDKNNNANAIGTVTELSRCVMQYVKPFENVDLRIYRSSRKARKDLMESRYSPCFFFFYCGHNCSPIFPTKNPTS